MKRCFSLPDFAKGFRALVAVISLVCMAFSPSAHAYYSSSPGDSAFGATGGFYGGTNTGPGVFDAKFGAGGNFNFLGCSFSLSQFIQTTFNLPSSFEEIKQALTTRLVKYFITNMTILPQLQAAIQDFTQKLGIDLRVAKEACNLNAMGRQQGTTYATCCQEKYGSDFSRYQDCLARKGSAGDECSSQTTHETNAIANQLCESVTENTRSLFGCSSTSSACGIMNFLPQFKLTCNGNSVTVGGQTSPAPVTGPGMADAAGMFGSSLMTKGESVFSQVRNSGANNAQIQAIAAEAVRLAGANDCGAAPATTTSSGDNDVLMTKLKSYLACSDPDPTLLARCVAKSAQAHGFSVTNPTMGASDKIDPASIMSLNSGAEAGSLAAQSGFDAAGTAKLLEVATICTINQGGVNVLDPNTLADLIQMGDPDRKEGARNAMIQKLRCTVLDRFVPFLDQQIKDAEGVAKSSTKIPNSAVATQNGSDVGSSDAAKAPTLAYLRSVSQQFNNMLRNNRAQCKGMTDAATIMKAVSAPTSRSRSGFEDTDSSTYE